VNGKAQEGDSLEKWKLLPNQEIKKDVQVHKHVGNGERVKRSGKEKKAAEARKILFWWVFGA